MQAPKDSSTLIGRKVKLNGTLRGVDPSMPGTIYAIIRGRPQVRFTSRGGDPCTWGVDWSMISLLEEPRPAESERS